MSPGPVIGIVTDNVDPNGMHRVKVEYPVSSSDPPGSGWARVVSPMAGLNRGMVMLPDVGTEVLVGFAYQSSTPYVLGALYNGADDTPDPYANEDGNNDHRRFWSRASHWLDFDDTEGDEHVRLISTTENQAISQDLDSAGMTVTLTVGRNFENEASESISIKCRNLSIQAAGDVRLTAGSSGVLKAESAISVTSAGTHRFSAARIDVNGGTPSSPADALDTPDHSHPPVS